MNKKGFTLVEILGVVAILGLLLLIVTPPMLNRLNLKEEEVGKAQKEMLKEAAGLYFSDHSSGGNCVSIDTLREEGYLNDKYENVTSKTNGISGISRSGSSCTP